MKLAKRIISIILVTALLVSMAISASAASRSPDPNERQITNADIALRTALEGIILLENNNNALPINGKTVALYGYGATATYRGGSGSGDPWNGGLSGGGDPRANFNPRWHVNIDQAFYDAGYDVVTKDHLEEVRRQFITTLPGTMGGMTAFHFPEPVLTEEQVKSDASKTDTAIMVISRNAGEGADRTNNDLTGTRRTATIDGVSTTFYTGDYNLIQTEIDNLKLLGENYKNVIVIVNCGGQIDTKFMTEIPGLDALIFMGQAGQEGGLAMFKLLTGQANFSGKTINTWAKNYSDYPASSTWGNNDGTDNNERYVEGIYVGYRYFDTKGIEPAYPFGYGLSYTDFDIEVEDVVANTDTVKVTAKVTNTGHYAGKEVVQVYYSAPDGNLSQYEGSRKYIEEKPYQDLIAYAKTDFLQPGEHQVMTITYKTAEMAYYNETIEGKVLDPGNYYIRVGNSSRNTHVAATLNLNERVVVEQLKNLMHTPWDILEGGPEGEVWSKTDKGWIPYTYDGEDQEKAEAKVISLSASKFPATKVINYSTIDETVTTYTTDKTYYDEFYGRQRGYLEYSRAASGSTTQPIVGGNRPYKEKVELVAKENITLEDVYFGRRSIEQLVAQMTPYELATLNCGAGWGMLDERAPRTGTPGGYYDGVPGCAAETTKELMDKYHIPYSIVNDGPGGLRVRHEFAALDVDPASPTYNTKVQVYNYSTAWPVSIVRAATWNQELLYEVGTGYGKEMTEMGITQLLGTSLNIHRDPLCGRNFEYYSEDPVVAGYCVSAVTLGLQSYPGIGADLKHFAFNNQETRRSSGNSVLTERTARDIYLKGFEIGIKKAQPMSLMTSYNLGNNVPTADDYDLLTNIVRSEWGFKGHIMTDWGGGGSTPAKSMHAGNDFITPGGPAQVRAILRFLDDNWKGAFKENGEVATNINVNQGNMQMALDWRSMTPSATGAVSTEVKLGGTYVASLSTEGETVEGTFYPYIIVNGNGAEGPAVDKQLLRTATFNAITDAFDKADAAARTIMTNPTYITTRYAEIRDGGKTIAYKHAAVSNPYEINICTGDLQKSAIANLRVIMWSLGARKYFTGEQPNAAIVNMINKPYHEQFKLVNYGGVVKSEVSSAKRSTLEQAIDYAEKQMALNTYGNVIESVRINFEAALDQAKAVNNDAMATQAQIYDAWTNLMKWIHALDMIEGDKELLSEAINAANSIYLNDYVARGQARFIKALEYAREVYGNPPVSQLEIDEATAELINSMLALRLKADTSILAQILASAKALKLSRWYTTNSVLAFTNAIEAAEMIMEQDLSEKDQQLIDNAAAALQSAIDGLSYIRLFSDVEPNDWFYDYVMTANADGLMIGLGNSIFAPQDELNRAMVVQVLYNMEGKPSVRDESSMFTDVSGGHWASYAITWASKAGIVKGYGDGKFGPDDSIKRQDFAAILHRYAEYKGYDTTVPSDFSLAKYTDASEISGYAAETMRWAVYTGLITGRTDTTLVPFGTTTRAECATLLTRFTEKIVP